MSSLQAGQCLSFYVWAGSSQPGVGNPATAGERQADELKRSTESLALQFECENSP